jgi:ribosomal protein L7/L12
MFNKVSYDTNLTFFKRVFANYPDYMSKVQTLSNSGVKFSESFATVKAYVPLDKNGNTKVFGQELSLTVSTLMSGPAILSPAISACTKRLMKLIDTVASFVSNLKVTEAFPEEVYKAPENEKITKPNCMGYTVYLTKCFLEPDSYANNVYSGYIKTIKKLREVFHLALKEAKYVVDHLPFVIAENALDHEVVQLTNAFPDLLKVEAHMLTSENYNLQNVVVLCISKDDKSNGPWSVPAFDSIDTSKPITLTSAKYTPSGSIPMAPGAFEFVVNEDDPMVFLKDSKYVGQKVHGTSTGSVYYTVGIYKLPATEGVAACLAARAIHNVKSNSYDLSFRMEWSNPEFKSYYLNLESMGFTNHDSYLSMHLHATEKDMSKIFGAVMYGTGLDPIGIMGNVKKFTVEEK